MPERRSSAWRAASVPSSARLTSRPAAISSPSPLGHDLEPEVGGRHAGVDGAAVGDVDRDARRLHPARDHVGRHVAERHRRDRPARAAHPRHDAPGRHVDRHLRLAVGLARDPARLHRPRAERDRAVPARGRVAVLVPEQHAEVGAGVVGRDREAAVHVGVPARLVAQQAAHGVHLGAAARVLAPLAHGGARDLGRAAGDDAERLARGVVVGRHKFHQRSIFAPSTVAEGERA